MTPKQRLQKSEKLVKIGNFSEFGRISPWKGQNRTFRPIFRLFYLEAFLAIPSHPSSG
jgi:hypothetical protein